MAKINSKIDQALRKEVIENGVLLGTVLIFGFNNNLYLYENEVYVEQFKLTDDDYVVTDFYQTTWGMTNTNIYNGKFNTNEPYAEELIIYMSLYNESLYLSNKKYREIAKQKFAELKKEYEESGLLDDINTLLKKSKSKTFRYSKYESEKNVGKSLKEGLIDIKKQIQNYADTNGFDITVQTTPKDELIIAFGGTSDTNKIYNALIKELKSRGADLSTVDVKKKNDIVIGTWNLNLINNGMFDNLIIDGTIDLIDNLNEVVDLHYVF